MKLEAGGSSRRSTVIKVLNHSGSSLNSLLLMKLEATVSDITAG
jgi:hypothetical protein